MWAFLGELLGPVVGLFGVAWTEDERPEARWFAVGCLVIALAVVGIIVWVYAGR
jgi:hypothetical protein